MFVSKGAEAGCEANSVFSFSFSSFNLVNSSSAENSTTSVVLIDLGVVPLSSTSSTSSANSSTSSSVQPYERIGPAAQSYGYGFGIGNFGGTISGALTNTLSSGINDSVNIIPVTSNTGFPTAGTVLIGTELITYTGKGTNTLTGATRGALGTTEATHSNSAVVTDASDFTGWGSAVQASQVTLESALWSLSNFGQVLVATIGNGKTFTWNAGIAARFTTRASTGTSGFSTSNNPTQEELDDILNWDAA